MIPNEWRNGHALEKFIYNGCPDISHWVEQEDWKADEDVWDDIRNKCFHYFITCVRKIRKHVLVGQILRRLPNYEHVGMNVAGLHVSKKDHLWIRGHLWQSARRDWSGKLGLFLICRMDYSPWQPKYSSVWRIAVKKQILCPSLLWKWSTLRVMPGSSSK